MIRAGGGGGGNNSPANPGYKRITPNFCEAWPRITVTGLNLADSGGFFAEQDFLDGVIQLNGVAAAASGLMFPSKATMLLMSLQCTVKSQFVLNAQNLVSFHGSFDGVNFWESIVTSCTEQVAVAAGTVLAVNNPILKIPVHAGSKIYNQIALAGSGSAITVVRLLGYFD